MRLLLLTALAAHAQVIVSMDLLSGKGAAAQLGRGIGAYTWAVHVCAAGPAPVSWTLIRMNFPEVRFYSKEQADDILAARVNASFAKRVLNISGYVAAAAGLGIQVENTLHKSPSQLGTAISIGGLAMPVITALATKNVPSYRITDWPPDVIALGTGKCEDYTALAAYGKAPETIQPRRIDPLTVAR